MHSVIAIIRNGRVELPAPLDWPEGTEVEITPLKVPDQLPEQAKTPMTQWPEGFFDRLREEWGSEPFERPHQLVDATTATKGRNH